MANKNDVMVPLDVPEGVRQIYIENYLDITKRSGRLGARGEKKAEREI